eukprot:TRINITY_DN2961_c0_g1_i3.p1 TRINITY_DN2961_c0_g1~~TRINITY_DN2961_c0_g1_i3.p1  ORF type:complete len:246 (+),score=52.33 TRINITY_DN2961_c0_g1_i3:90-740(+)
MDNTNMDNTNSSLSNTDSLCVEKLLVYWSQIVTIQELPASVMLTDCETVKSLSLVSKPIFNILKPFVEHNFYFRLFDNDSQLNKFVSYNPTKCSEVHSIQEIPLHATHLRFSNNFNTPILSLPNNLTFLVFGEKFNLSVDNVLPHTITSLKFGKDFDTPISALPPSLTFLEFGFRFDKSVQKLPHSIKHLIFKDFFNQPIDGILPPDLLSLNTRYV